jgi:hypothetical protein
MVKNGDTAYHTPANAPHDWAETSFFYFYVPQARVMAWVYLVARPGVGAIVCDIEVSGDLSMNPLGSWYTDIQQHLRLPERFEKIKLSNGLEFTAKSIRDYRLDYIGVDDTEIHVDVDGLMEPYDIHDPSMDPLAVTDDHGRVAGSGFGAAYANHFDMTCRVRGTLKVRGRKYDVDCVATMDHSWGPRAERGMAPMSWINAHFGTDYALQSIWSYDPRAVPEKQFKFAHGYALVDGKVRGAKAGSLVVHRLERFGLGFEMSITDIDGRVHTTYGSPLAMHLWTPYTCTYVPTVFLRWQTGDRVGYGNSQENNPLDRETGYWLRSGALKAFA